MKKSEVFDSGNLWILAILIITFFIVIFLYSFQSQSARIKNESENKLNENQVTKIIDGDTFELASGEIVRLLCIDTPEEGKQGYEEAKTFLENLILNKQVRLEREISDKDKYNRSLRYAYIKINDQEIQINKEILDKNYGTYFQYGNDTCEKLK